VSRAQRGMNDTLQTREMINTFYLLDEEGRAGA
jgi:hypothetical protein